jgi:hypothetical protein
VVAGFPLTATGEAVTVVARVTVPVWATTAAATVAVTLMVAVTGRLAVDGLPLTATGLTATVVARVAEPLLAADVPTLMVVVVARVTVAVWAVVASAADMESMWKPVVVPAA